MNQETILIADYLSATNDKQSQEVIERYAQATHLSIGRAEDRLDALVHLMGFRHSQEEERKNKTGFHLSPPPILRCPQMSSDVRISRKTQASLDRSILLNLSYLI